MYSPDFRGKKRSHTRRYFVFWSHFDGHNLLPEIQATIHMGMYAIEFKYCPTHCETTSISPTQKVQLFQLFIRPMLAPSKLIAINSIALRTAIFDFVHFFCYLRTENDIQATAKARRRIYRFSHRISKRVFGHSLSCFWFDSRCHS